MTDAYKAGREAGIREAAEIARMCIYHDSAGTGFEEDKFDAAILALLDAPAPAGVAVDDVPPLTDDDRALRDAVRAGEASTMRCMRRCCRAVPQA